MDLLLSWSMILNVHWSAMFNNKLYWLYHWPQIYVSLKLWFYSVHENWYPKINETTEQYTEHCTCRLFWLNHKLAKLFPLKRNNALSHDDFHKMQLKHRIHTSEVSQNLIWDISINNNNSLDQVISMSLSTQQGEMIVLFPSFWHVGFAERSQRN